MSQLCVVIGAGISGLVAGWKFKKQFPHLPLMILEASERAGGWIETIQEEDFFFEQGPRSFRPSGSGISALQLIESLGMQEEVISASSDSKKRYIYVDDKLQLIPCGLLSLTTSPLKTHLLKALWQDFRLPAKCLEDETVAHFVERRLGANIANLFFDPLVSGIYAGDIQQLSMKSCFPMLLQAEKQYGCLWKSFFAKKSSRQQQLSPFVSKTAKKGIFTLRNGIQSLVNRLVSDLKEHIHFATPVEKLSFMNGIAHLELENGKKITAESLYLAIPPKSLNLLLKNSFPDIASVADQIPCTSVATVNLGYHSPLLDRNGFGYLIPSCEKQSLLGVVWDSVVFPQQNAHSKQTRLTAMMGGVQGVDIVSKSKEDLVNIALDGIERHLKIRRRPDYIRVKKALNSIPQYNVGHSLKVTTLERELKKLCPAVHLLGNAYRGLSVSDCIRGSSDALLRRASE